MSNPKCLPMIPALKKPLYLAFAALFGLTLFCLAGCSGTASRGDDSQSKAKPQEVETTERQEFEKKNRIIGNAKKEVQRIFGSWEKPDFALLITGRQHGYIEPCGCTGLENQKGGLLRRHTLSKTLESKGWNLVKIDAGNQVRRFGPQPEIKFKTTAKTLAEIFNYDSNGDRLADKSFSGVVVTDFKTGESIN
mgnify:CR=1 FL=1